MACYNSKERRNNQLFLRNCYEKDGKYSFPLIKKQNLELDSIDLISYSDTRNNESEKNKKKVYISLLMIIDLKGYITIQKEI